MKYNIEGFSQVNMIQNQYDCIDAVILRWYADFEHSNKMVKIKYKNKIFYWLKYDYIINEIPIINIKNKESLYRRFKKYVKHNHMEHYTKKNGGVYSCYRLTENFYNLISDSKSTQKSEPIDSKVGTPIDSKVGTKDSSIKDNSSIKDKIQTISKFKELYKHLLKDYRIQYVPANYEYIVFATGYNKYKAVGMVDNRIEYLMKQWFRKKLGAWCGYALKCFWNDIGKIQAVVK
jgi:hypothetical protein